MAYLDSGGVTTLTGIYDARYKKSSAQESATNLTGIVPVANGGTGLSTITANAVVTGNGQNAATLVNTANGALFATSAGGAASFGTLPVAQGGTGATTAVNARSNLGAQALITGAATSVTTNDLTANRILVSNSSGKIAVSSYSDSAIGHASYQKFPTNASGLFNVLCNSTPNTDGANVLNYSASLYYDPENEILTSKNFSTVNGGHFDGNLSGNHTSGSISSGVTATTQAAGDSSTKIATTAFVSNAIGTALTGAAMYKGAVNTGPDISNLSDYKAGWYWVVATAGTYCGQACEVGDMIFCNTDRASAYSATNFDVVQSNITAMTTQEITAAVAAAIS